MENMTIGKQKRSLWPFAESRRYSGAEAPVYYPEEYEVFDEPASRRNSAKRPQPVAQKKSKLWIAVMATALAAVTCGTLIVIQAERITEAEGLTTSLQAEINSLQEQYAEKMTAFETISDFESVRQTTSQKLHMGSPGQGQLVELDGIASGSGGEEAGTTGAEAKEDQLPLTVVPADEAANEAAEAPVPEAPKAKREYHSLLAPRRPTIDVDVMAADPVHGGEGPAK